jgi:hypothetical protein
MSFEANEWRPEVKEENEDDGLLTIHRGKLGGASLSFNRADWEIGNWDEFYIGIPRLRPSQRAGQDRDQGC